MNIHIIIPHFKCIRWLNACLQCLIFRASQQHDIHIDVLTMEIEQSDRDEVRALPFFQHDNKGRISINLHEYPVKGKGGEVLPYILRAGVRLLPDADITMTVDPDALTVVPGWDDAVVKKFQEWPELTCYGINPRGDSNEFFDTPEWNWMAFKTKHWHDHIGRFDPDGIDIGHRFKYAPHARYRTIPMMVRPFTGKIAAVCGVDGVPYVLHAFYSSRRVSDYISDSDRLGILTPEQEQELIQWALNPSALWGTTATSPALSTYSDQLRAT